MLLTEAAEGGAGVLAPARRRARRPRRASPARALEIIHYDPDTGADLGHAPGARERCERGCYDCLLSYANQYEHSQHRPAHRRRACCSELLDAQVDRRRRRPRPRRASADWLNKLRDSGLETRVRRLARPTRGYRLPDDAQRTVDDATRPARLRLPTCPATRSRSSSTARTTTTPHQQQRDDAAAERLEDLGWTVVRVRHDDDWAAHRRPLRVAVRPRKEHTAMTATATLDVAVGSLVRARGREWVVLPGTTPDFLLLQPLGGGSDDVAGVFPDEGVEPATFPPPTADDLGDAASTDLLRTALRVGFPLAPARSARWPASPSAPRSYQYVPLLMALRQDTVRLLIADDVGIGKTIEAGLIAAELLAQGDVAAPRRALLARPGRAVAARAARQVRHRRRAGADQHRQAPRARPDAQRVALRPLPVRHRLHRLHQVRPPPPRVPAPLPRAGHRRRGPQLRRRRRRRAALPAPALRAAAGPRRRPDRHLVLATATPHSGDEDGLRQPASACSTRSSPPPT